MLNEDRQNQLTMIDKQDDGKTGETDVGCLLKGWLWKILAIPIKCFEVVQMFMMNWLIFINLIQVSTIVCHCDKIVWRGDTLRLPRNDALCICTYNLYGLLGGKGLRNIDEDL